ncbi:MAG: YqaA family protein [Sideroxyarcus sp.]|nr:YqaA family protein [Sideroxyarcus sp.]
MFETLQTYLTNDLSLWGLFISSLLGATLLPGGSEFVLAGVLTLHPEAFWPALLVSSFGNTLGGMITFGMGRMLPLPLDGSDVVPAQGQRRQLKHVAQVRKYGVFSLLFAWAPLIGDALCLSAGWLRLNWWQAALFMAVGKFARYWVIAAAIQS